MDITEKANRRIKRRNVSLSGVKEGVEELIATPSSSGSRYDTIIIKKNPLQSLKRAKSIKGSNLFQDYSVEENSLNGSSTTTLPLTQDSQFPSSQNESNVTVPTALFSSPLSNNSFTKIGKSVNSRLSKRNSNNVIGSSLFGAVMKSQTAHLATPEKKASPVVLNVASPGGRQLLNFLQDSPCLHATPPTRKSPSEDSAHHTSPQAWREWYETKVTDDTIGIVDWTIFKTLQIDTQPKLPLLSHENEQIRQQGLQHFCMGRHGATLTVSAEVAWQSGLYYWMHPSTPPPVIKESRKPLYQEELSMMEYSQLSRSSSMRKNSRMPSKKGVFSSVIESTHENDSSLVQRRRLEWQEAFQSLYRNFIFQARQIVGKRCSHDKPTVEEVIDTYFYVCGKGQTVLFRLSTGRKNDGEPSALYPDVVLSSSNSQMRSKLRYLGITLRLLYPIDASGDTTFEESQLQLPSKAHDNDPADSPRVRAELLALRRAQISGQYAGADVSVSVISKKAPLKTIKQVPSLCISGFDDCETFFKAYLDTCGGIFKMPSDVPTMYCRKVGPFLHSALKSNNVTKEGLSLHSESSNNCSIHVHGPIFPCAIRRLMSAAIANIRHDHISSNDSTCQGLHHDEVKGGSHHLVVKTIALQNSEDPSIGYIGVGGSDQFNDAAFLSSHNYMPLHKSCADGESLCMLVWDSSKSDSLAYKVERLR
jgi:hypothetical protein